MGIQAYVRLRPEEAVPPDVSHSLDLFGESNSASTIELSRGFFGEGPELPQPVSEFFLLAAAVYCLDKTGLRLTGDDAWTRNFTLEFPASSAGWTSSGIGATIGFLTGDHWDIRPRNRPAMKLSHQIEPIPEVVCLFSGGLDSLIGAIELLESNIAVRLVGHHEAGLIPGRQRTLFEALRKRYGSEMVGLSQIFLRPAPRKASHFMPLPLEHESTTRSRSLLFIACGLTVAAAVGPTVPVYIPENGFIGLNIPLSASRLGSLSTRTTHPHFISQLETVLSGLSIRNPLVNPYRFSTKGEMLGRIRCIESARNFATSSVSCAHPEVGRWRKRPIGNCGYCYPCLIRRAAMHRVGWDTPADYAWDALNDSSLLSPASRSGADLRALIHSLAKGEKQIDHLRSGPIAGKDSMRASNLYLRGRREIRNWVDEVGSTKLADWIAQH